MSYVLEALKRASTERERHSGAVPGLAAQATGFAPRAPRPQWMRWALLAVLDVLVLGLVGLLVWRWTGDAPATAAKTATATAPLAASAGAGPSAPATLAAASNAPAPATQASATLPVQAAAAPALQRLTSATPGAPGAKLPAPPSTASLTKVGSPTTLPPRVTLASQEVPRLPTQSELPERLRSALPKLVVNAAVYTSNPAERLLILNGQTLHEGDTVAPDLVLEHILAQTAVLRIQGTQFSISY